MARFVWTLPLLAGCELAFPLDGPDRVPCTPGELQTFDGEVQSAAVVDGVLIAAYLEPTGAVAVRAIDRAGELALPRMLNGTGEAVRVGANADRATITLHTAVGTGWDQVISTSMRAGELESVPSRRTDTGVHTTSATGIALGNEFIVAARRNPGGGPDVDLGVFLYDSGWKNTDLKTYSIDLGNPVALVATQTGLLLQTDSQVIALDSDRNILPSATTTTGFDEIRFIGGTPAEAPALIRTSGGAIEIADLDELAGTVATRGVIAERAQVSGLHAQTAGAQILVVWSEAEEVFALRTRLADPVVVPAAIAGTTVVPRAIYQGDSGPLVVADRDGANGREVVVTQVCDP